jgi:hypothetical protein
MANTAPTPMTVFLMFVDIPNLLMLLKNVVLLPSALHVPEQALKNTSIKTASCKNPYKSRKDEGSVTQIGVFRFSLEFGLFTDLTLVFAGG